MATVIAFTGHRQLRDSHFVKEKITEFLSEQLRLHSRVLVLSGGALGVDQLAAEVCVELNVPFIFILPFPFNIFTAKWPSEARAQLRRLASHAVRVYYVQREFSYSGYQRRNEILVSHCDILCAVYNGLPGGTANTIRYARAVGRPVHFITP